MICIIALVVFSILGIFSATHRKVAAEAFDCVFRKLTLRKCQTGLDQRLKSQIVGSFSKKSRFLGRFVYKNFEIISWFFTILMLLSIFFTARGIYYYAVYGNCNGPNSDAFCIFDPTGNNKYSSYLTNYSGQIILPDADNDYFIGPADAKVTVIMFGCFKCPYTKKVVPTVQELINEYQDRVKFVFRDFPLTGEHVGAEYSAQAAECARDQGKYWEYYLKLFNESSESCASPDYQPNLDSFLPDLDKYAQELGLDVDQFSQCLETGKYEEEVNNDSIAGIKAGVTGTPTFFINGEKVVGPKSLSTFRRIINLQLKKVS